MSSTTQPLCVKGCGFYGSSENRNMCSKCYKDYLKQELISISETLKSVSINEPEVEEKSEMKKIQKNRCDCCSKKVGLTGFNCRCGKLLCGMHRYPQEHACPFDFKELDRRVLSKQNVLVKADKLDARI
ncbi:Zinc finger A20 and AN1 domain-containing stress-associated protein 1 [Euphorbia peplus]|nr:Zinc finger A20 and AN1 domain-containing stress-associated protein 1 [Euphorbia peplus]